MNIEDIVVNRVGLANPKEIADQTPKFFIGAKLLGQIFDYLLLFCWTSRKVAAAVRAGVVWPPRNMVRIPKAIMVV